ncbi:MAG: hypothetical protein EXR07_12970 [Acetobacteraceae bacterium]|nr:hypothetical protein [Acetobacteraceae bacterium]
MTLAPPPPTAADAKRVTTMTLAAAKELRRHGKPPLDPAGAAWMEQRPQTLWPLLDAAVAANIARPRDEALVAGCHWLLVSQLELIRYRLDSGHDWARAMLDAYQERLIELARASTLSETDWFALVNLLRDAEVPIRPEMAKALAHAASEAAPEELPSPRELPGHLRGLLDELGRTAEDPFMVVEALGETGALMPADIRAYLTHELGLSPHAVLREAVPLLLLDPEPAIRQAAAAVLEQIAVPETFSPTMLRRGLLVRNWVPEAEREAIDRMIRKARVKGVVCAQWPAAPALAIQCSMVDGSGAQAMILTTAAGRTGPLAGLLLKQGFGVRDAWCDQGVARREITRSIKETQREMAWLQVGRDYLDVMAQHHIKRGLSEGNPPRASLVEIAEVIGAADWKDRGLDVEAETNRLLAEPRGSTGHSGAWLVDSPMMLSWFEDDPTVRALVRGRPRPKHAAAVQRMLDEVLPARRAIWTERLLLMALWLRAGPKSALPAGAWRDCAVLAHDLVAGRALADLPAMVAIAERSVYAARANNL